MWRCLNCSEIEFLKNFKKFWLEDEKFEIFLIQKCPTFRPARWISIRSLTHPAHVVRSPILGYLISFLKFHCNRIKKTLCSSLFCAEFSLLAAIFKRLKTKLLSFPYILFFSFYWVDDKNRTMIMSAIRTDVLDTTTQTDMPSNRWYRVKEREKPTCVNITIFVYRQFPILVLFFLRVFQFPVRSSFPLPTSPSIHHRHRFYWILFFLVDFWSHPIRNLERQLCDFKKKGKTILNMARAALGFVYPCECVGK
jgi:hypothetical protein